MPARPVRPSPQTKPATTNRLFQGSTSSWFSEWRKARETKNEAQTQSAAEQKDEPADALARWLTGGAES